MRLDVVGNAMLSCGGGTQNIHVSFNPATEITSVVCLADVLTTRIAERVLHEKYIMAIKDLDAGTVEQIEKTVEEALYGQNRSTCFEHGCNPGIRKDDGCDGQIDATWPQDPEYGRLLSFSKPAVQRRDFRDDATATASNYSEVRSD